jgi:hypothetical protein
VNNEHNKDLVFPGFDSLKFNSIFNGCVFLIKAPEFQNFYGGSACSFGIEIPFKVSPVIFLSKIADFIFIET